MRLNVKTLIKSMALAALLLSAYPPDGSAIVEKGERPEVSEEMSWQREAEEAFDLREGLGGKLLLKEEWDEHKKRMAQMGPDELEAHKKDIHRSLMRRAKRQGLD